MDMIVIIRLCLKSFAIALAGVFLLAGLMALTGCNAEKKAARKDNAALERVKASRKLLDNVAPVIQGLYPCANDTFFRTKRDTLIKYDTESVLVQSTDTINKVRVDTLFKKITVTKTIHDTAFIVDKQKASIDAKVIETQELTIAALNQNIIDLNATIKKRESKITWLTLACILGGIVILGLVYLVCVK
jgi:hypothetical protein